jgi:hypothetical protein
MCGQVVTAAKVLVAVLLVALFTVAGDRPADATYPCSNTHLNNSAGVPIGSSNYCPSSAPGRYHRTHVTCYDGPDAGTALDHGYSGWAIQGTSKIAWCPGNTRLIASQSEFQ